MACDPAKCVACHVPEKYREVCRELQDRIYELAEACAATADQQEGLRVEDIETPQEWRDLHTFAGWLGMLTLCCVRIIAGKHPLLVALEWGKLGAILQRRFTEPTAETAPPIAGADPHPFVAPGPSTKQ